jgi:hypothetical protein
MSEPGFEMKVKKEANKYERSCEFGASVRHRVDLYA